MEAGGGRNKKICRICRAGGGVCRQGLRKTHERADPACRFHGSDARGNTAVARGDVARGADQAAPRGEGSSEAARPRQHVPFEQMTRFVTKGGIGLHYLPGPLDQWACRDVVEREGEWHDNQAGRPLNEAEKGEYTQYIQRHEARRRTGREADKLAKIVDKYLPDVSQETRSYMIRFPHEVHKLLAKARRIRRKLKAKRERQAVGSRPGRTSTVRKAKAEAKQQRAKRAATSRRGAAKPTQAEDAEPPIGGGEQAAAEVEGTRQPATKGTAAGPVGPTQTTDRDDLHDEVDWGSVDPASAMPDKDTESANSDSPEGGVRPEEQRIQREPEPASGSNTSGPAALQHEPGLDGSNTRTPVVLKPNLGAQRPRTPSRSPRRRTAEQPGARAVQQVQDHMRASRLRRSRMQAP